MEDLTDLREFVQKAANKVFYGDEKGWSSIELRLNVILRAIEKKLNANCSGLIFDAYVDKWYIEVLGRFGGKCEWNIEEKFEGQTPKTQLLIAKILGYKSEKLSDCCSVAIQPETDICSQCKEHCEIVEV